MKMCFIMRDARFSPNSERKDRNIMQATIDRISAAGHDVVTKEESDDCDVDADVFVSMGRLAKTLVLLEEKENEGHVVFNAVKGIRNCQRSVFDKLMKKHGMPVPQEDGNDGYWIKRGDACAQSPDDVKFAGDEVYRDEIIQSFRQRGISDIVVSAHIKGDLIKFYRVKDTSFFKYYYPTQEGDSKFGLESINGRPHFYPFDVQHLMQIVDETADIVGLDIYGGDAIVTPEGKIFIIDFNDWPSFSRFKEEAADAIVEHIIDKATYGKQ